MKEMKDVLHLRKLSYPNNYSPFFNVFYNENNGTSSGHGYYEEYEPSKEEIDHGFCREYCTLSEKFKLEKELQEAKEEIEKLKISMVDDFVKQKDRIRHLEHCISSRDEIINTKENKINELDSLNDKATARILELEKEFSEYVESAKVVRTKMEENHLIVVDELSDAKKEIAWLLEQEKKSEIMIDDMVWDEESTYDVMRKWCDNRRFEEGRICLKRAAGGCSPTRKDCPLFSVSEPERIDTGVLVSRSERTREPNLERNIIDKLPIGGTYNIILEKKANK